MMEAVLSNSDHPEFGEVTIPLPIPREQYDHCIELVNALEIGSVVAPDCHVSEICKGWPVFYRLEGNHWYRFHNGDKSEQNLEKKAKITRFYWNLNNKTHLFDDNGKETAEVLNSYFWKKWK